MLFGDSPLYQWFYNRCEEKRTLALAEGVNAERKAALTEEAAFFFEAALMVIKHDELRSLLAEWENGLYDGQDFLRRVRLALHGDKGLQVVETTC